MKHITVIFLSVLCLGVAAESGELLYRAPFDKLPDGPLSITGNWQFGGEGKRCFRIDKGKLVMKIEAAPRRGDALTLPVPLCNRGQLDFKVKLETILSSNHGAGLVVSIYNITTFFHDYCRDWRSYFPAPEAKRESGFNAEPPGHSFLSSTKQRTWMHCRIVFDRKKDYVEFFLDDMENPVSLCRGVSVWGSDEFMGGRIIIANMGQTTTNYECQLKDLELRSLPEVAKTEQVRNRILVLCGYNSDLAELKKSLTAAGTSPNIYHLASVGSTDVPVNNLAWGKLPGSRILERTRVLLLNDAPAGPGNILPNVWLENLADNVQNGLHLIVTGGLFSLERGEYCGTPLEKLLPATLPGISPLPSVKTVRRAKIAGEVKWRQAFADQADLQFNAAMPHKDAKIWLMANDRPLLWSRRCGKGRITVLVGNFLSGSVDESLRLQQWNKLLLKLIQQKF